MNVSGNGKNTRNELSPGHCLWWPLSSAWVHKIPVKRLWECWCSKGWRQRCGTVGNLFILRLLEDSCFCWGKRGCGWFWMVSGHVTRIRMGSTRITNRCVSIYGSCIRLFFMWTSVQWVYLCHVCIQRCWGTNIWNCQTRLCDEVRDCD